VRAGGGHSLGGGGWEPGGEASALGGVPDRRDRKKGEPPARLIRRKGGLHLAEADAEASAPAVSLT